MTKLNNNRNQKIKLLLFLVLITEVHTLTFSKLISKPIRSTIIKIFTTMISLASYKNIGGKLAYKIIHPLSAIFITKPPSFG
jgi:hypothetical protein